MKSGTYFLIIFIISNLLELELLNTPSKSDSTPSKDILISGSIYESLRNHMY